MVMKQTLLYQPTFLKEWKSSAICGIAVAMTVPSYIREHRFNLIL